MTDFDRDDVGLNLARMQLEGAAAGAAVVRSFFDNYSGTISYVVHDPETMRGAVIDSVLEYDPASGRTSSTLAQEIISYVWDTGIGIDWILETHAHADHLSAAPLLKGALGGAIAIGALIVEVQKVFGAIFNVGPDFIRDGSDFDKLWTDGEQFSLGKLPVTVLHVPGHTPACVAYVIGDVVFIGDTMFMPDFGSARADFPGGDARSLYRSIRRILALPDKTPLYMCHDYLTEGRHEHRWISTVAEQRRSNVHIHEGVDEAEFIALRQTRDAMLAMPQLLLPSVQVNIRAGRLPPAEDNGTAYLKIPVNRL